MSLANDQNWATSEMLKMPTQMKNATPTYGSVAPRRASANSSMLTMKNSVTPTSSLTRSDARGEPAVQRHESHQHHRLSGRRVRPHLGAAAKQDQRLAHGLDDRIADEEQEDVHQHQHRRARPRRGGRRRTSDSARSSQVVSSGRRQGSRRRIPASSALLSDSAGTRVNARRPRGARTTSGSRRRSAGERAGQLQQMHLPPPFRGVVVPDFADD